MLRPAPHCTFRVFVVDSYRAELWLLYAFNLFLHCAQGRWENFSSVARVIATSI